MRGFELIADEPPDVGGGDAGPTPTEMLLSSLAVCFTMAIYQAGRKRSVELPDLAVRVRGDYEGPRFNRIVVEVLSSHPRTELEKLVERAISYCYVSNTLSESTPIDFVISEDVSHPTPPPPA